MKTSEQHPRPDGNDTGHASERVPLAAQVFGNYVLVAARRGPDGHTRPAGLHGAALMVFADESAEKIQLRTGYATHVAGAALDARKDVSDQIVSSQGNSSEQMKENSGQSGTKGNTMPAQIACSACRTVFVAGPKFCPSCGLPLTAQAIPVVKKQSPLWWFMLKIGIGLGVLAMLGRAFTH